MHVLQAASCFGQADEDAYARLVCSVVRQLECASCRLDMAIVSLSRAVLRNYLLVFNFCFVSFSLDEKRPIKFNAR
jgi:hypothetical protein